MARLSQNQIESITTIVSKQRKGLLKYAEEDGRARDAATILETALSVLAMDFYQSQSQPLSDLLTDVVDVAELTGDGTTE